MNTADPCFGAERHGNEALDVDALRELSMNLLTAAKAVVGNWAKGDLAGAVNWLEGAADELEGLIGSPDATDGEGA